MKHKIKYHSGENALTLAGFAEVSADGYLNITSESGDLIDRWDLKHILFDPHHLDQMFLMVSYERNARIELLDELLKDEIIHLRPRNLKKIFNSYHFLIVSLVVLLALSYSFFYYSEQISLKVAQIIPEKIERKIFSYINSKSYFSVCSSEDQTRFHSEILKVTEKKHSLDVRQINNIQVIKLPLENAFAFPDGSIYITESLIKKSDSLDEIFGVIGHELGHLKLRHHLQTLVRSSFVTLFIGAFSGDFSSFLADPSTMAGLFNLKYSRNNEKSADIFGLNWLKTLNLSHKGLISFFKKMQKPESNSALNHQLESFKIVEFMSTHPLNQNRIDEIEKEGNRLNLTNEISELSYDLNTFSCK